MTFLTSTTQGRTATFSDFVNASPIFNQPYSFLTKTNKTLAVTQGLRPLYLLRLVEACFGASFDKPEKKKKKPSFLRLASQQEKP